MALIQFPQILKPPIGTQLNRAHPIARQMRECVLFNHGGASYNYQNRTMCIYQNTPTWTQLPGLPGMGLACASGNGIRTAADNYNFAAGAFTVRVVIRPTSLGDFQELMARHFPGEGAEFVVGVNSNLNLWTVGGTNSAKTLSIGLTSGVVADVVIVRDGGFTVTSYRDGVLRDTDAGVTGTTGNTGDHYWNLGYTRLGGFSNPTVEFYSFQAWTRALTAEEIAFLYRSPYCFMQPRVDLSRYALQAAAAAATPDFYRRRIA